MSRAISSSVTALAARLVAMEIGTNSCGLAADAAQVEALVDGLLELDREAPALGSPSVSRVSHLEPCGRE